MTRTARQPVSLVVADAPAWALTLAWDLSAKAGSALAEREGAAGDPAVAIELSVEPGETGHAATVRLVLVHRSGTRRELQAATGAQAAWRREGRFEHFDAPGIVNWSARADGGPVFARCPWIAQAGVPAGSYSLRGGG